MGFCSRQHLQCKRLAPEKEILHMKICYGYEWKDDRSLRIFKEKWVKQQRNAHHLHKSLKIKFAWVHKTISNFFSCSRYVSDCKMKTANTA